MESILEELPQEIEKLCGCGFTAQQLIQGEFQCLSRTEEVTYRAKLSGTVNASNSDIIADIEEWVISGQASLRVQGVRRLLDRTCLPVAVESFSAQECGGGGTPTTETTGTSDTHSNNTAAVVGGVVVVVVLIIAIAMVVPVIAVLVLKRRRRAQLSIQKHEQ